MTSPDADIPPQSQPEDAGIFHTLWITLRTERLLAVIFAGTGLFALLVIHLTKMGVTADGIRETFNALLPPAAAITAIIFLMGSARHHLLGRAFTYLLLVYFLAGMKQFLVPTYPPPSMPPFYCFMNWFAEGCPGSPKYNHWARAEASAEVVEPSPASTAARDRVPSELQDFINPGDWLPPGADRNMEQPSSIEHSDPDGPDAIDAPPTSPAGSATDDAAAETPGEQPPSADLAVSPGPIFMQFAGSLQRERIVALAQALSAQGWKMQGADRGGERTAAAAGFNEVRFFYPEDRQYAEALAAAIIGIADWVPEMRVVDLSASGYKPPRGQLEIWTSR